MEGGAMKRAVRAIAILYFVMLVIIWSCIHFDTGKFWPTTLFLFAPRWVVAIPLIVLVPLTLATRIKLTPVYFLHCWIIAFPIMGFCLSWTSFGDGGRPQSIRVMTCNLGAGKIRLGELIELIRDQRIQVLMLQESPVSLTVPLFQQLGWSFRQENNMAIGSLFESTELRVLARHPASSYNTVAAIECMIQIPTAANKSKDKREVPADFTTMRFVCVHLPTFRPAFEKAQHFDSQAGVKFIDLGDTYRELAQTILDDLKQRDFSTVIAGDFNVPVASAFYREFWGGYRNAFTRKGIGFGYSKYTRFHGIRIDHVLADNDWDMNYAFIGPNLGGDHCPTIVELFLIDKKLGNSERQTGIYQGTGWHAQKL